MTAEELVGKIVDMARRVLAVRKISKYPFESYAIETWQIKVYGIFPFKKWYDLKDIYAILS